MRFFKTRKKEVTPAGTVFIPAYFEHLTLGRYCDYYEAGDEIGRLAAATGLTRKKASEMNQEQGDRVMKIFENAVNGYQKEKEQFKLTFDIGSEFVGFEPEINNMSYGAHIDAVNNCEEKTIMKTLPKVMAILYRPVTAKIGRRYQIEPYDSDKHLHPDRVEAFREMPMPYVKGALAFFLTIADELKINLELSSMESLMKIVEEQTNQSEP